MCLATSCQIDMRPKGPLGRFWHWITRSPLRLLSFSSLIHGAVLCGLILNLGIEQASNLEALASATIFGIVSLPLAGYLMTALPNWFHHSGLHYGWSFSTFLAGFTGLSLLEIGLLADVAAWLLAGNLMLLLAWGIALRGLWWIYKWISRDRYPAAPQLMLCLLGGLAGLAVFVIGAIFEVGALLQIGLSMGALCLWILASAGTLLLRNQAAPGG